MIPFHYVATAQEVLFGAGALARLPDIVERFGWRRLLLCTVNSLTGGPARTIAADLGDRLAATYTGVRPHVPWEQVQEALVLAREHKVEAIIGLGGGSPIGLAKAVSLALEEEQTGRPARAAFPTDQPLFPVVAIPTTYAGSEMTPIYGVTRPVNGGRRKITVTDAKAAPRVAIYDPALTLQLSAEMTATTGVNALAHCIEAVYSVSRHPLSTAAALRGVFHLTQALPQAVADGQDLAARAEMLAGSHLAAVSLATVKMGLHHGLCHVLGGSAGLPHGLANCIMLPHAVTFNLETSRAELAPVAATMALEAVETLPDALHALIGRLGVPQRLRDLGLALGDLPRLAEIARHSMAVQNNPRPAAMDEIEAVYRAAW